MSQIDMKELYSTINQKTLKRMELYDSILKKCHTRILYNSGLQRTYCFYQIPEFIIGFPLYDILELRKYVMNSLKTNGFKLLYIEPNWLFIHWNIKGAKSHVRARGERGIRSGVYCQVWINGARDPDGIRHCDEVISKCRIQLWCDAIANR